jgi:hypothetical protein
LPFQRLGRFRTGDLMPPLERTGTPDRYNDIRSA